MNTATTLSRYREQLLGLSAFDRHKKFIQDYVKSGGTDKTAGSAVKTDHDTLRETYRFLRTEEDDKQLGSWEQKIAHTYYTKLFKEYCIADLSRYKEGAIGLRWRTEAEVHSGKGQFFCGGKRCNAREGLGTFEVDFAYVEAGQHKSALVKLRVCKECAHKLNYKKEKKRRKEEKRRRKERKRKKRRKESDDDDGHRKRRQRGGSDGSDSSSGLSSDEKETLSEEEDAAKQRERDSEREKNAADDAVAADAWTEVPKEAEQTKEEEFEQYFVDMFL